MRAKVAFRAGPSSSPRGIDGYKDWNIQSNRLNLSKNRIREGLVLGGRRHHQCSRIHSNIGQKAQSCRSLRNNIEECSRDSQRRTWRLCGCEKSQWDTGQASLSQEDSRIQWDKSTLTAQDTWIGTTPTGEEVILLRNIRSQCGMGQTFHTRHNQSRGHRLDSLLPSQTCGVPEGSKSSGDEIPVMQ